MEGRGRRTGAQFRRYPVPMTVSITAGVAELAPQVHHRHADGVGERVDVLVPHALEQRLRAHDGAVGAQQHVQHAELLRAQRHRAPVARDLVARRVQAHAGALEDGLLGHGVAALQRVQPRHDLGEREGLGQVVVGAEVEPLDARADVGRRGEHQDPRRALGAHELAADLVAVDVGQVAVQHDHVVVDDGRALERLIAVERDVDGESVAAKAARERLGEPGLVFGDEDAHGHGEPSVT